MTAPGSQRVRRTPRAPGSRDDPSRPGPPRPRHGVVARTSFAGVEVCLVRFSASAVWRTTAIVFAAVFAVYVPSLPRGPSACLLIAAFIALALSPPVKLLNRRMRRGVAIAIVYIGLLLVPVGFGVLVVPPVVTQAQQLVDHAPRYAKDVSDFIQRNRTLRSLQKK